MADIDIEKLPIDLHGIALANGLPSGITAHPAFKAFMREYKRAFAALVLEEAAETVQPMGDWCGGHGEPRCPTPNDIAAHLRTIAEGLKK